MNQSTTALSNDSVKCTFNISKEKQIEGLVKNYCNPIDIHM